MTSPRQAFATVETVTGAMRSSAQLTSYIVTSRIAGSIATLAFLLVFALHAHAQVQTQAQAQAQGVIGDWREPGGSAIRVLACGQDICLRLIQLSPQEPHRVDGLNPDPAKRTRALCGLEIGSGFHLADAADAEDGHLYDPKSGRTYHGLMQATGDDLRLRGYVGFKAFGRTEHWTRIPGGLKGGCG